MSKEERKGSAVDIKEDLCDNDAFDHISCTLVDALACGSPFHPPLVKHKGLSSIYYPYLYCPQSNNSSFASNFQPQTLVPFGKNNVAPAVAGSSQNKTTVMAAAMECSVFLGTQQCQSTLENIISVDLHCFPFDSL